MKPDWDKLMDAFADSETALVADVDCTAEGKQLCTDHGVKGYVSENKMALILALAFNVKLIN